jgi:hypothetical protein
MSADSSRYDKCTVQARSGGDETPVQSVLSPLQINFTRS